MARVPYFLSAQLNNLRAQRIANINPQGNDTGFYEGWFGLIICSICVWITVFGLDLYLLSFVYNTPGTHEHVLQLGAFVAVCVHTFAILLFTVVHLCYNDTFSNKFSITEEQQPLNKRSGDLKTTVSVDEARILPPFATALMSGSLSATQYFSFLILRSFIMLSANYKDHDLELKILVAQVGLKTFSVAMAKANARLQLFADRV